MPEEEGKQLTKIIQRFDDHFLPKLNITYERYVFFNRKQREDETIKQYIAILKNLTSTCNFGTLRDELVNDVFVSGIKTTGPRLNHRQSGRSV